LASVVTHGGQLVRRKGVEQLDRLRALQGDHRILRSLVVDFNRVVADIGLEPSEDFFSVAGVDNEAEASGLIVFQNRSVDQDVVEHAACFVTHQRVTDLLRLHVGDTAGHQPVEKRGDIGPVEQNAAHVRDVEQADRLPLRGSLGAPRRSRCTARASTSQKNRPSARRGRRASRAGAFWRVGLWKT